MKDLKLGFSLSGAFLIIFTFVIINLLTSPAFPWSIFPAFAVLWWPIGVYAYSRKSPSFMALSGASLSMIFFIVVNLVTSPSFPWSIFPVFVLLWWPLAIFTSGKGKTLLFSFIGAMGSALFFITVNVITSSAFPWSFFPVFLLIWWPLSHYCGAKRNFKMFSLAGTLLVISFFFITDYITTPSIQWAFYVPFPMLIWPALMILGNKIGVRRILLISGPILIGYYLLLNIFVSPAYPWSLFVIYAILIAMISSYFWYAKSGKKAVIYTVIVSILFVTATVLLTDIKNAWSIEAALIIVSSQTCVYLSRMKKYGAQTLIICLTVLILAAMENYLKLSNAFWSLYSAYPIVLALAIIMYPRQIKNFRFAIFSSATGILYYGILNALLSPAHPWVIYPAFALLWWPLGALYYKNKNSLLLALLGCFLIIAFFVTINMITSPGIIWSVFPSFAALWWPLSMMYLNKKRKIDAEENDFQLSH